MWNFPMQSGFATTIVDFTNDFSWLNIGLVGLMGLSAGIVVFTALRHYLSEKAQPAVEATPAMDYREAA